MKTDMKKTGNGYRAGSTTRPQLGQALFLLAYLAFPELSPAAEPRGGTHGSPPATLSSSSETNEAVPQPLLRSAVTMPPAILPREPLAFTEDWNGSSFRLVGSVEREGRVSSVVLGFYDATDATPPVVYHLQLDPAAELAGGNLESPFARATIERHRSLSSIAASAFPPSGNVCLASFTVSGRGSVLYLANQDGNCSNSPCRPPSEATSNEALAEAYDRARNRALAFCAVLGDGNCHQNDSCKPHTNTVTQTCNYRCQERDTGKYNCWARAKVTLTGHCECQ